MTGAEAIVWWVVARRGCRESGGLQGKWVVDVKRCTIIWLLRNGRVVEFCVIRVMSEFLGLSRIVRNRAA